MHPVVRNVGRSFHGANCISGGSTKCPGSAESSKHIAKPTPLVVKGKTVTPPQSKQSGVTGSSTTSRSAEPESEPALP